MLAVVQAVDRRIVEWPSGPTQDEIKGLEQVAPTASQQELLRQTSALFVTPFDREDVVTLAFAVDDVADAAENAAELFGLYGVESTTKQAIQLSGLLVQATERLAALLGEPEGNARLVGRDPAHQGDRGRGRRRRARGAGESLQGRPHRPGVVIRWKDIYEALEDAVDACETAAHRVGNILVKNA